MRKYLLAIIGLVLLCLMAALGTTTASPDTVTVNSTTDLSDGDTSSIGNLIASPGSDGVVSLREAIEAANNNAGSDTIAFDIPVSDAGYEVSGIAGTWTISLTSSLPTLTDDGTIISGTTQADLNPDGPEIEISAASLSGVHCLVIESASNVVHGLVINRCPLIGVLIQTSGADYNTVSGNYIGIDASGSTDLGNGTTGVMISDGSQGNVVGGDTPEERNVISGNNQYGVYIYGDGTDQNTVSGNYVGTDATGTLDRGNTQTGVAISYGAQNNTVGGDTEGERNIISGNGGDGVSISGSGTISPTINNTVSGNYIGTVVSGTQALGNTGDGVEIGAGAQNNTVGGDTEGERNVISANSTGVRIGGTDTMTNTVSGNYIGTDVTGTLDRGNTNEGVRIASGAQNNTVGGQTAGERNVISGNNYYGVWIGGSEADGNTVAGNYIGTDAAGAQELGNTYDGVLINDGAQNNTIGGQTAGARNVIAASTNSGSGVHIFGTGTDGNTVSHNYIGTDATGTQDKGNSAHGVRIDGGAQNNTVGPNNLIAYNDSNGVFVNWFTTVGNTISQNSIHSNTGLGIQLSNGGNGNMPHPDLDNPADCTSVTGQAMPNATIEVFSDANGQGRFHEEGAVSWNGQVFTFYPTTGRVRGRMVTATVTDPATGNTSPFSDPVHSGCPEVFLPLAMKSY